MLRYNRGKSVACGREKQGPDDPELTSAKHPVQVALNLEYPKKIILSDDLTTQPAKKGD